MVSSSKRHPFKSGRKTTENQSQNKATPGFNQQHGISAYLLESNGSEAAKRRSGQPNEQMVCSKTKPSDLYKPDGLGSRLQQALLESVSHSIGIGADLQRQLLQAANTG